MQKSSKRLQSPLRVPCFLIFFFMGSLFAENSLIGTWLTEKKKAQIQIYEKQGKIHGKIVWMDEPNHEDGTPKLDQKNPNPKLQIRKILGLELLRDFEEVSEGKWENGKIYDPESGKDYSCILELKSKNELDVRGFIGVSLFGRTQTWTRVQK